jgi:hypothetical protein
VFSGIRVEGSHAGERRMLRFARRFPHVRWAVEGAKGLGAPLTEGLRADDLEVIDLPG